jgi:LPS sulfotransferase NodH
VSEPFHPKQICQLDSDYIVGAKKQLNIIKDLSVSNELVIKDNQIFNIKYYLYMNRILLGEDLSEHSEMIKIFEEYNSILDNFYKIKLVRNNIFQLTLSLCIAEQTDVWHKLIGSDDNVRKIILNPEKFKECLHEYLDMKRMLNEYSNYETLIEYEELKGTYNIDCTIINNLDILPVTISFMQSHLKNDDKIQVIENYEEILKIYEREMLNVY